MTPRRCARCASPSRPMELVGAEWRCLAHRPHLVLVADRPSELESLLMASLAQRDDGRLLNRTHNALRRVES